jgi:hypothetical protein
VYGVTGYKLSRYLIMQYMIQISTMQTFELIGATEFTLQTPWPEPASELYRPSDRSLSAKLEPTRLSSCKKYC